MFVDVLNLTDLNRHDDSSLSTGIMAGAPCPQEVAKGAIERLNMKDFMANNRFSRHSMTYINKIIIYIHILWFIDCLWDDRV